MNVASPSRPPSRELCIKVSRSQRVSAICFDSFLLTAEPHSHVATSMTFNFGNKRGSEARLETRVRHATRS